MLLGVLALQGAFREHCRSLVQCGVQCREVRTVGDLSGLQGLILPGGESTVMGLLLQREQLLEPLRLAIMQGLPVYGICAGLILLCRQIENSEQPRLGVLDATVRRNAYGRQNDSFETDLNIQEIGAFHAVFIRAPKLVHIGEQVKVLASYQNTPVIVRAGQILATAFHPELTTNLAIHRYFLELCK